MPFLNHLTPTTPKELAEWAVPFSVDMVLATWVGDHLNSMTLVGRDCLEAAQIFIRDRPDELSTFPHLHDLHRRQSRLRTRFLKGRCCRFLAS